MAQRKAWTKKKRQQAARKGIVTRRKRNQVIEEAKQSPRTGYALLLPFGAWLKDSIKLPERIARGVSMAKGKNSSFPVPQVMTGLVLAFEAGITHTSHLGRLVPEVKLAQSIGMDHFFGATTATNLLKASERRHLLEVRRLFWQIVDEHLQTVDPLEIDVVGDTTGHPSDSRHREAVAVGYCNGRKCPCLKQGRVVINGLPVYVQAFPGNGNPKTPLTKALALARLMCRRFPDRRVHVGLDSGFAGAAAERQLYRLGQRYGNLRYTLSVAVAPNQRPAQTVALAKSQPKKQWKRVNQRSQVLDIGWRKLYQASDHRVRQIVVHSKEEKPAAPPAAARAQKKKKKKKAKKGRADRYYVIATNYSQSERKARAVFGRHHQRPVVELSIKDSKQSYDLNHLPHRKFAANQMFLLLASLAQLLGMLFNRRVLPSRRAGSLIATVRADLWALSGPVITASYILLDLVYHRLRLIRQVCRALRRQFGITIVIAGLDSS